MSMTEDGNCLDTMLDMLCHEMIRGSLSPEMEILFAEHIEVCAACRKRISGFLGLLATAAELQISRMVH